MVDKFPKETRSKIMKSIRSKTKMEDRVCRELWKRGLRFRRNIKDLPGKPDIAIKKYKAVVFLDSCFWHVCDIHGHFPQSNIEYWDKKLNGNKNRDKTITKQYVTNGWNILRVWEHQINGEFELTVELILDFFNEAKTSSKQINITT
jgi:DNA mismatch endonuclease (patch repair protein)